jgi:hypothetical protein
MITQKMNEMAVHARINPPETQKDDYPVIMDDYQVKLAKDGWLNVMTNGNTQDTALSTVSIVSTVKAAEKRIENTICVLIGRTHADLGELADIAKRQYSRSCLKYGGSSKQAGQLDALLCHVLEAQNAMASFIDIWQD